MRIDRCITVRFRKVDYERIMRLKDMYEKSRKRYVSLAEFIRMLVLLGVERFEAENKELEKTTEKDYSIF